MCKFPQPAVPSIITWLLPSRSRFNHLSIVLLLACATLPLSQPVRAAASDEDSSQKADAPPLALVFFDDFSTDPNTNGKWAIHRYAGNPNTEAAWDAETGVWHLTRPSEYIASAVFANYDLTATEWKAEFTFRVDKGGGLQGGGDGFVFMFYKDKDAYGRPAYGTQLGFELYYSTPVAGYGLKADYYYSGGECDPINRPYLAVIQDDACNVLVYGGDDRVVDQQWHTMEFRYKDGKIYVSIDLQPVFRYNLPNPDYTYTGIGFGAGTGSAFADHQIANFRLWVRE